MNEIDLNIVLNVIIVYVGISARSVPETVFINVLQ